MDEQIARSTRGEGGEDTTTLSSLVGAVVEVVVVFVVVGARGPHHMRDRCDPCHRTCFYPNGS